MLLTSRCVLILSLLCAGTLAPRALGETVDRILATVGDEAILQSDLMLELGAREAQLRAESADDSAYKAALDEALQATLQQAINEKILLREALLAGYSVEEKDVEKRLDELRQDFPTNEDFRQELLALGLTVSDVRADMRKKMLARGYSVNKQLELEKNVVVTESEVAQYYQDHKDQFGHAAQVRAAQIFLEAPEDQTQRAVVRGRLEQIREELEAGADFEELARQHSAAPGADEGGIIGWIEKSEPGRPGDLIAALEEALFSVAVGEISQVVESPGGFHILKALERREAGESTLEDARKEIEPILRGEAARKLYDKWMDELRKRSAVQTYI